MFSRQDERDELLFHLGLGRSILMLAPRRVGKTFLIKRLAEDLRGKGWMAVLCDVEGVGDEAGFLRHLCQMIEAQEPAGARVTGRAKQFIAQLFGGEAGGDWQAALGTMDWASFAETLVRGLNGREQRTVILIDELALFVVALLRKDSVAASHFLYHLRALLQRYPNVCWVFTGSIGLDTIAKREGIGGALLDLTLYPIAPFAEPAARAFIDHLCASGRVMRPFVLDDAAFARLVEELGWLSPFYLEHIGQELRATGDAAPDGRRFASVADIERAFEAMLAPMRRNYFVAWEEHLSKNFPPKDETAMRRILDGCATQTTGEQLDTLLLRLEGAPYTLTRRQIRDHLTVLVADGYLSEQPDGAGLRYRFRSGLLRRYWLRYHAE